MNKQKKNNNQMAMSIYLVDRPAGRTGFSLVEMIIAMFVFSLVSTMVLSAYANVFQARSKVRAVQQNVEDARYAMELMAKTLRTSSVFSISGNSILAYDYSQKTCLHYKLDGGGVLQVGKNDTTARLCRINNALSTDDQKTWISNCALPSAVTYKPMTTARVNRLNFAVTSSTFSPNKSLGKVTIGFEICYKENCTLDAATLQTSVSLRDYGYVRDGKVNASAESNANCDSL